MYNMDESSSLVHANGHYRWGYTGSESIRTDCVGNVKHCFTVSALIRADGTRYPLHLIAKGKAETCGRRFHGQGDQLRAAHRVGGRHAMIKPLRWMRHTVVADEDTAPNYLLLDSYPMRKCVDVCKEAGGLGIELIITLPN